MNQEELKSAIASERIQEFREAFKICASYLSLPLYLAFWLLDLFYAPHMKWQFLAMRVAMIPINLFARYLAGKVHQGHQIQLIAVAFAFFNSVFISYMTYLTEGFGSSYYAGLTLVTIGIFTFFPWSKLYFPIVVSTIFAPYFVFNLIRLDWPAESLKLLTHTFFIFSTVLVSITIRFFHERLKKKEVEVRLQLKDEVISREQIIKEKTTEGLRLGTLTKQFSPQVVHAITSGHLNIDGSIAKSPICVIFVDIVNSTDRVNKISHEDLDKVLALFMEDTMEILLKYDITIDKFLGDGVLGFSNAPIHHKDYVERVVKAALDIIRRLDQHREEYGKYWNGPLAIKVGIASGSASVGFYGSEDYFKSYTAIGSAVNLASRLCSAASANQIIISNEAAAHLPTSKYKVLGLPEKKLKGFENEVVPISEIQGYLEENTESTGVMKCPSGHGILHLDTNEQGIYVFKCRTCGHEASEKRDSRAAA